MYYKLYINVYYFKVVALISGVPMTLRSVFEELQLDAYDLNVDILDVHAVS